MESGVTLRKFMTFKRESYDSPQITILIKETVVEIPILRGKVLAIFDDKEWRKAINE